MASPIPLKASWLCSRHFQLCMASSMACSWPLSLPERGRCFFFFSISWRYVLHNEQQRQPVKFYTILEHQTLWMNLRELENHWQLLRFWLQFPSSKSHCLQSGQQAYFTFWSFYLHTCPPSWQAAPLLCSSSVRPARCTHSHIVSSAHTPVPGPGDCWPSSLQPAVDIQHFAPGVPLAPSRVWQVWSTLQSWLLFFFYCTPPSPFPSCSLICHVTSVVNKS